MPRRSPRLSTEDGGKHDCGCPYCPGPALEPTPKPRRVSTKPPSAKQLAAREAAKARMAKAQALRKEHPDWDMRRAMKAVAHHDLVVGK